MEGGEVNNATKMAQIPLGMPADEVRRRVGQPKRTRRLGKDKDPRGTLGGIVGKVFEWEYPWGILMFKRRRYGGAHCYRVVEKRMKDV